MTREQRRRERYKRLRAISDAGLPALTVARGNIFLEHYPDFGPAWVILGIALTELARHEEAEEALLRAIELCPEEKRHLPLSQMGHHFDLRGDLARAEEWYRRAIDASPKATQGYIYLGALMARQGRLNEAEMFHRSAIGCEAGCIDEAYLNLGFVLRAQLRFVEAAECFLKTLSLDPDDRRAKKALRDVRLAMRIDGGS